MGKNEIKLRDELTTSHIHRHRDYDVLMKRHRRSRLFKRTLRFFMYSLVVTILVLLLIALSYYIIRLKQDQEDRKRPEHVRTAGRRVDV